MIVGDDAEEEAEEARGKEGEEGVGLLIDAPLGNADTVLPRGDDILRV